MEQILASYGAAVSQTKTKMFEDINRYMETEETIPAFEQYLRDRSEYMEQLWMNVWLNKVTNDVSKQEKKEYLNMKGYATAGVDRKIINKLFRDEMRMFQMFNVNSWIYVKFSENEGLWQEKYEQARAAYFKRKENEKILVKKGNIRQTIEKAANAMVSQDRLDYYLYVRYYAAKQLKSDLENNVKYDGTIDKLALEEKLEELGAFNSEEYDTVGEFFQEYTGGIHKTLNWRKSYFEYETYEEQYEKNVSSYLFELIPEKLLETIPSDILDDYLEIHNEPLHKSEVKRMIADAIADYAFFCMDLLGQEYLDDMLRLAEVPFDVETHQQILEEDLQSREEREALRQAELERRKAEEARMLDDIFGQEYRPAFGRNIQYFLHIGETNTGKTHHALERMKEAGSGIYLAPLRLLALEVFDKLNADGVPCSLKTGEEEKEVLGSRHLSCTVEMFHEKEYYEVVVIDEAQMIADKDRGFSWYKAITKANAREVHIIGSKNIKEMMLQLLSESQVEINEYKREVPLQVEKEDFTLNNAKKGDALVCFSRRQVLETAARLQNSGHTVSMIYGSMPPETRKKQMQQFIKGETKVIVATDAIGMGLNLPIRRIVFLENEKFDGTRRRRLTSQEVKQIAGRAGRKGIYDVGKVAFTSDIRLMRQLLDQEDVLVTTFAIAPTSGVFERFQKYFRTLEEFFELWDQFESPKGTKKASLSEERELYELVRGTEIEARLSMMDLYGFLHLPFSQKESALQQQWLETVTAIVNGTEWPEPIIKGKDLEEMELTYKAIGLHLLFLYRLEKQTEAIYWERVRLEISDGVHEHLNTEVKNLKKTCRNCGKKLSWESSFAICDACHANRARRNYYHR
ncbi:MULTISPECIES: DEAD/DEAH box helicase [unclassified Bacillus (in: firmicutes)]|uniref:DEAD/DEAH box helicase n=1 Tax=unclassified Bacillus (in: firmicutes) TaxID=185979 RepID=UPI0008E02E5E|nr:MULTISPECIES: DEAD/DEAH box helicase [unclassified Bacillus (in: firmicutes)]SFA90608.1 ATP-dependent RNA helicase SUPV3L1/SUV3 [Bacillus sp. UNCCL13]SFQ85313.1 ATP-dependent RNA helicase SUPV3L1/SUV3 [Bacillus sp. cl95]